MADYTAYFGGQWMPFNQVRIDPLDRGFLVGDCVFDVARTFNGKSFRMREHVDRLYRSLAYVRIDPGLSPDEMERISEEVIARNEPLREQVGDYQIWQFVTRGRGRWAHRAGPPAVGVCVRQIGFSRFAALYDTGAHGIIVRTRSFSPDALDPKVKNFSRMNFNLAELEASDVDPEGWPILTDSRGNLTEGVGYNLFIVAKDVIRTPGDIASGLFKAARDPAATVRAAREAAEGIGEIVWAGLNPAPETPLNVPIGPHRRVWWTRSSLADFKAIKDAVGGTVNDVVLAVVSGALGRWLRTRGVRTEGLELRALVPVSVRPPGKEGDLGNQIAAMRGPLPVYATDPLDRLEIVKESMAHLKQSKQALGAEVISSLNDFAPPTLLAQASRLNFSTRLFNLIVTNVPGPQFPLYLLGRELQELAPIAFLPEDHALAVAIMSYNGRVDFGLLGDYDAMPDLDVFTDYIEDALAELMEAAGVGKPTTPAGNGAARATAGGIPE